MLSGVPQWQAFRTAWQRLICPCPVVMVISDAGLLCSWRRGQQVLYRTVAWPKGACRDGVPLQGDAIAECLADLVFDLELPGAELVLSLPPAAAKWCVLDGLSEGAEDSIDAFRERVVSCDLPFDPEQSYLALSSYQDCVAVSALPRPSLRAWVDVVERADLPLRRLGWTLINAQQSLIQITQDWAGDLAWLLVQQGAVRLILMRDRVPEVDHRLSATDCAPCCAEARACLISWQQSQDVPRPLGWWITLDHASASDWSAVVDADSGEQCLNKPLSWSPQPWSDADAQEPLPDLAHLALMSLNEQESW